MDTVGARVFKIENHIASLLFNFARAMDFSRLKNHPLQYIWAINGVQLGHKPSGILLLVYIVIVISMITGSERRTKGISQSKYGFKEVVDAWF